MDKDNIKPCFLSSRNEPSLRFRFDVENEFSITRTLTVSSKWNESGFAVAQAAAAEPAEITMSGKIGYLVSGDTLLNDFNETLDMAQNRLSMVQGSVLGGLIKEQTKAVSKVLNGLQTATHVVDNIATKLDREINGNNRLERLKNDIKRMFAEKKLLRVVTFKENIDNAIITNFTITHEDKIDQVLTISLSLKEIRFVKLKTANLSKANFAQNMCRADIGLSPKVESGQAATAPTKPDNRTSMLRNSQSGRGLWD